MESERRKDGGKERLYGSSYSTGVAVGARSFHQTRPSLATADATATGIYEAESHAICSAAANRGSDRPVPPNGSATRSAKHACN